MKEKIREFWKDFWKEHWLLVIVLAQLIPLLVWTVITMRSPFKKDSKDLGFVEMHENVKYAVPYKPFASTIDYVTDQEEIDAMLSVLHEAEFREILWTTKYHLSGLIAVKFYTAPVDEQAEEDDWHEFMVYGDIRQRQIIRYTHGGRTRYFACTKVNEFREEVRKIADKYTEH